MMWIGPHEKCSRLSLWARPLDLRGYTVAVGRDPVLDPLGIEMVECWPPAQSDEQVRGAGGRRRSGNKQESNFIQQLTPSSRTKNRAHG